MRKHGYSASQLRRTEINIYHDPMLYADSEYDYDNLLCEKAQVWAERLAKQAKELFPLCRFIVGIGIHDADHRIYAIITIQSTGGSHKEAADWFYYRSI